jgi:hypothetical protein
LGAILAFSAFWHLEKSISCVFSIPVNIPIPSAGTINSPINTVYFSQDWAAEPLDSYQKILHYARTTKTQTGVAAYLDRRNYPCGLKATPDQLASLQLQRHETLPEWNYTIKPQL